MRGVCGEGGKEKNEENIVFYCFFCCVSVKDDCEWVRKFGISIFDCVKVFFFWMVGWFCIYYGLNIECCNFIKI